MVQFRRYWTRYTRNCNYFRPNVWALFGAIPTAEQNSTWKPRTGVNVQKKMKNIFKDKELQKCYETLCSLIKDDTLDSFFAKIEDEHDEPIHFLECWNTDKLINELDERGELGEAVDAYYATTEKPTANELLKQFGMSKKALILELLGLNCAYSDKEIAEAVCALR